MNDTVRTKTRTVNDPIPVKSSAKVLVVRSYTLPVPCVKMLRYMSEVTGKSQSKILAFLIEDAFNRWGDKYKELLGRLEVFST